MTDKYVVHWQKLDDDFWGKPYDHYDKPDTQGGATKTAEMLTYSSYADVIEIITYTETARIYHGHGVPKHLRHKQPPPDAPMAS